MRCNNIVGPFLACSRCFDLTGISLNKLLLELEIGSAVSADQEPFSCIRDWQFHSLATDRLASKLM